MKVYQFFFHWGCFRNATVYCAWSAIELCEIGFVLQGHFLPTCCFLPQVHFVPDAGTVAQIVYTDDQVRPPQQVVYTADGASYASVDGPEHTLVYIHPVEAAQACEGLLFVVRLLIG